MRMLKTTVPLPRKMAAVAAIGLLAFSVITAPARANEQEQPGAVDVRE